jgi:hypothetical protein
MSEPPSNVQVKSWELAMLKVKGTHDAWDTAGPAKRKAAEERLVREGFGVVS